MSTVIQAYPRLHLALADLGHATLRRYGGAGFSLSGPIVEVGVSDSVDITLETQAHLDDRGRSDVIEAIRRAQSEFKLPSVAIQIRSLPPQHVGFGTKTAMLLAALKAYDLHCQAGIPDRLLQRLSNRGGASGVGTHTFFHGGFVIDGGHCREPTTPFGPSSSGAPSSVPPLIVRLAMPEQWAVGAFLLDGNRRFGDVESRFFERHTPIPDDEVLRTISHLYHGAAAAIATADLGLLRSALSRLHECGFKRRELDGQPAQIRQLVARIQKDSKWPVGLSSMGPLVYCIGDESKADFRNSLRTFSHDAGISLIGVFRPCNTGYSVVRNG